MKRDTLIKKFKDILNLTIEILDKHTSGRKNKFNNYFYLNYIMRILFYGEHWNTFYCDKCDRSTIRKKFYKWQYLGVFRIAHEELLLKYVKNRTFKKLFIDATIIENFNCNSKMIDYYYKIKSKKQLKLSIISDLNNVPLSYILSNPKPHDSTFIKPLIKQLHINIKRNSQLIGDAGYLSLQKQYLLQGKKLNIITPIKKNQIVTLKKKQQIKSILRDRYKVEQTFSHLKRSYCRVRKLEDRHIKNYETFLLMAFSCQIIKQL